MLAATFHEGAVGHGRAAGQGKDPSLRTWFHCLTELRKLTILIFTEYTVRAKDLLELWFPPQPLEAGAKSLKQVLAGTRD